MSKEYIERGALIAFLDANHDENDWMVNQYNADWICSWIDSQPTADVVEVKHAHWVGVHDGWGCCSNCHRMDGIDKLATHCRFCGAYMRDGGEDNG